jgi:hypothetical protein
MQYPIRNMNKNRIISLLNFYNLFVGVQVIQDFRQASSGSGMYQVGSYLDQRHEDKSAFVQTGMWNCQLFPGNREITVKKDVQVDGARTPPNRAFSPESRGFYPLKFTKKLMGGKRGLDAEGGVEEIVLFDRAHRLRVVESGQGGYFRAVEFAYLGNPAQQIQLPVSQVRTKGYIC